MIYTCSYNHYQSNLYRTYSISGNRGKSANYDGLSFSALAPKKSFWNIWHNNIGVIPVMENNHFYIESYYRQVLKSMDPQAIYTHLNNSILLCYEEPNEFCHRHIVAAWFELLLNIHVPEVTISNSLITEVPRPNYIKDILKEIILKDNIESMYNDNLNFEMIINRQHLLSSSFVPSDLIVTDNNEDNFHQFVDPTLKPMISASIYPQYLQMKQDMERLGLYIILDSGYRSYYYQQQIMEFKINELGPEVAYNLVAPPGASEHQTGLAFDISLIRDGHIYTEVKETDPEVIWLIKNSYKYGFILRYPKGKEHITGYQFEPWHYRYVGLRLSTLLTKLDLTLEEYYENKLFYNQLDMNNVNQSSKFIKLKKYKR